jgi:hypothetical protein
MADFNSSKVDGDSVDANEWNQLASIDNFISTSGQTPSTSNLNQMGIGAARYSSGGQFFTDSGTANAYVLTSISPFKSPVSSGAGEGYFIGMEIKFRAGNPNTGASTVNLNSAGVKNLKKEDGTTNLVAGDIQTTRDSTFRYNGTVFVQVIQANFATTSTSGTTLLPSPITIANNATDANNDIDFSAGVFQFSDGSGQAVATAMIKRLDANWAAGTNQGGLDTGSKANSTWYHCYAIYNPTTLASDFLFSTGATTPTTLPSGYTKYKRVGSIKTDSSGNILGFFQNGTHFFLKIPVIDFSGTSTTTLTLVTLSTPLGIKTIAILSATISASAGSTRSLRIFSGDASDQAVSANCWNGVYLASSGSTTDIITGSGNVFVPTSTFSQVFHEASASASVSILTQGWIDNGIL